MEVYNNTCTFGPHISTGCCSYIYISSFQSCRCISEQKFNELKDEVKDLVEEVKEVKRIVSNIWDFLANQRPPLPALSEPQSVCQSPPPLPPPLQLTTEFPPLSQHSPFTENSPGMSHCVCLTFQPLVPRPVYNCLPLNSLQTALPVPLSTCQAPPPVHVTQPPPLCQLSGFAENSLGT